MLNYTKEGKAIWKREFALLQHGVIKIIMVSEGKM